MYRCYNRIALAIKFLTKQEQTSKKGLQYMASRKQRKAKKHTQSNKNSNLAQDQVSYLCRHFPSLIRITNLFSIINIQKLLLKNGMSPYMDPRSLWHSIGAFAVAMITTTFKGVTTLKAASFEYNQICVNSNVNSCCERTIERLFTPAESKAQTAFKTHDNRQALALTLEDLAKQCTGIAINQKKRLNVHTDGDRVFNLLKGLVPQLTGIYAVDGSIVSLSNEQNINETKGSTKAGLKFHGVFDLTTGFFVNYLIDSAVSSERKSLLDMLPDFKIGSLIFADRGYYGEEVFDDIAKHQCFYIIRGKTNLNPEVESITKWKVKRDSKVDTFKIDTHTKGEPVTFESVKLQDILNQLQEVNTNQNYCFDIKIKGGDRIILVYNPENKDNDPNNPITNWVLLRTNLPDTVSVNIIAKLYRLRWQVELGYKSLKTSSSFDSGVCGDFYLCKCFMSASIITYTIKLLMAYTAQNKYRNNASSENSKPRTISILKTAKYLSSGACTWFMSHFAIDDLVDPIVKKAKRNAIFKTIAYYLTKGRVSKKQKQRGKTSDCLIEELEQSKPCCAVT